MSASSPTPASGCQASSCLARGAAVWLLMAIIPASHPPHSAVASRMVMLAVGMPSNRPTLSAIPFAGTPCSPSAW